MSINLMSLAFKANFSKVDIKEGEGVHTVKPSTIKFVLIALADHANDEGKGAYPSLATLSTKTSLERKTVARALDALELMGVIKCVGISEYNTDNYSIFEDNLKVYVTLGKGDSDSRGKTSLPESHKTSLIQPSINTGVFQENQSTQEYLQSTTKDERKENAVGNYLAMANFQGAKTEVRIDSILSYLGESFVKNTSTKEWKEFAKYILSEHKSKGWDVEVFVKWLKSKPDYKPDFWSVRRMMEFYPQAFFNAEINQNTERRIETLGDR